MEFFLGPLIGAFIGWVTNVIAITLLFRPYKPILGIQGLLPKNKEKIAKRLGEILKIYLLNNETISKSFTKADIKKILEKMLKSWIEESKNPLLHILKLFISPLSEYLAKGIKKHLPSVLEKMPEIIKIDALVEEKVKSYDLRELEKIVYQASGPEIRFIKLTGAILGFIIGLLQIIILKIFFK